MPNKIREMDDLYYSGNHFIKLQSSVTLPTAFSDKEKLRIFPVGSILGLESSPNTLGGILVMALDNPQRYSFYDSDDFCSAYSSGIFGLCDFNEVQRLARSQEITVSPEALDFFYSELLAGMNLDGGSHNGITPVRPAITRGGVYVETNWNPSKEFPGVRTNAGSQRKLRRIDRVSTQHFDFEIDFSPYYFSFRSEGQIHGFTTEGRYDCPGSEQKSCKEEWIRILGECCGYFDNTGINIAYVSKEPLPKSLEVITAEDDTGRKLDDYIQECLGKYKNIAIAETKKGKIGQHLIVQLKDYDSTSCRSRIVIFPGNTSTPITYDLIA